MRGFAVIIVVFAASQYLFHWSFSLGLLSSCAICFEGLYL
jgi:hypothetical protein